MSSLKIVSLLRSLDEKSWSGFVKYAGNEYFNSNKTITKIIKYLKPYYPDFSESKVSVASLNILLYDNPNEKNTKLQRQLYLLKVLLERFVLVNNVLNAEEGSEIANESANHLLHFYRRSGLVSFYKRELAKQEKNLRSKRAFESHDFYFAYQLEQQKNVFHGLYQDIGQSDMNYIAAVEALDEYYLIEKLRWASLILNRQNVLEKSFHENLESQTIALLQSVNDKIQDQLETWYCAYTMLKKVNNESYRKFKFVLFKNMSNHPKSDQRILFTYLINNARKVTEGEESYYVELFELYSQQLNSGTLMYNNSMLTGHFLNIVTIALRLGLVTWAQDFHLNNAQWVNNKQLDWTSVVKLTDSMIQVAKGSFRDALNKLDLMEIESPSLKLAEKRLRLICYFELGELDMFDSLVNSSRKFVSVNKKHLTSRDVSASRNFFNLINRIRAGSKIRKELYSSADPLPEKYWFINRIDG